MNVKYISDEERNNLDTSVFAGPGRTYPIRNQDDLDHAEELLHMSSDKAVTVEGMKRRARELGLKLSQAFTSAHGKKSESYSPSDVETVAYAGGSIKALGDGKLGGYLVRFGGEAKTDLSGEYFTKDTNFMVDFSEGDVPSLSWYDHAMDETLGKKALPRSYMKVMDDGIWAEIQMNMHDKYEKKIYELGKGGFLGWSSGTAPHLIEREKTGKSVWIKTWPLGLDASLTPTPCEYRNTVSPVKSSRTDWEKSFEKLSEKEEALRAEIRRKHGDHQLVDHDDKMAYHRDWDDNVFASPYEENGGSVTLGEAFPVRRKTIYEPTDYSAKSMRLEEEAKKNRDSLDRFVTRLESIKALRDSDSRPLSESVKQYCREFSDRLAAIAGDLPAAHDDMSLAKANRDAMKLLSRKIC